MKKSNPFIHIESCTWDNSIWNHHALIPVHLWTLSMFNTSKYNHNNICNKIRRTFEPAKTYIHLAAKCSWCNKINIIIVRLQFRVCWHIYSCQDIFISLYTQWLKKLIHIYSHALLCWKKNIYIVNYKM